MLATWNLLCASHMRGRLSCVLPLYAGATILLTSMTVLGIVVETTSFPQGITRMKPSLVDILTEISSTQQKRVQVVSGPFHGGSHVVYEIQAHDLNGGERWCLRIPRDTDAAAFAAKGTDILRYIKKQRPALWAPSVIFRSERYVLMEFLDGAH